MKTGPLLASASTLALCVATAAAAAEPAIWTGPYAGLNLGAGWHGSEFSERPFSQFSPRNGVFWSPSTDGVTVGGQAGYNWQYANLVFGVEADFNWLDAKATATFSNGVVSATSDLDWFGTARGRLGWSFANVLVYGTGGLAVAHIFNNWGVVGTRFTSDDTRTGWVAGGGIEYMVNRHWTARVEALYADLGTSNSSSVLANGINYRGHFTDTLTTVRGALNWKW
jgi:outer membrane immunogenic protein